MKKLILFCVGIIIATSSFAQTVTLPEPVFNNMVDELIIKDGLVIEVDKQRQLITVYQQSQKNDREQIAVLTAEKEEYEQIIKNKEQLYEYVQAELKDKKRQANKLKFKNVLLSLGISIETLALILILLM